MYATCFIFKKGFIVLFNGGWSLYGGAQFPSGLFGDAVGMCNLFAVFLHGLMRVNVYGRYEGCLFLRCGRYNGVVNSNRFD